MIASHLMQSSEKVKFWACGLFCLSGPDVSRNSVEKYRIVEKMGSSGGHHLCNSDGIILSKPTCIYQSITKAIRPEINDHM